MSIKELVLKCGVFCLRAVYAPMKLQKTRKRITIISRQSNTPTLDIALLSIYFKDNYPEVDCKILCRKLEGGSKIGYALHMLSQMKAFATSKVVVLDGYCIAGSVLNHKKDTEIVQMWHALAAIKKFGYQTVGKPGGRSRLIAKVLSMHKNYDYVICSSEVTLDYLSEAFGTPKERFRLIGLPRIDSILEKDEELVKNIEEKYGLVDRDKEVILYAPTFRRGAMVKVGELVRALDPRQHILVVKLHPLDVNVEDIPETGLKVIRDSSESSFHWLKVADRIVTDYSALGVEATLTDKPIYFFLYDFEEYTRDVGLNVNPLEELPEASCRTGEELKELIDREYDWKALDDFRKKYISVNTVNCTKELGEFIHGIVEEDNQKIS